MMSPERVEFAHGTRSQVVRLPDTLNAFRPDGGASGRSVRRKAHQRLHAGIAKHVTGEMRKVVFVPGRLLCLVQ